MSNRDFFHGADEVVIFDLEWTTWEGAQERKWSGPGEHRELVQIAAQKININEKVVQAKFSRLVRPRKNSQLSDYFIELTHISQKEIDTNGADFALVYEDFLDWSDGLSMYSYSVHKDHTDGDILKENIDLYGLDVHYPSNCFKTIAPLFLNHGVPIEKYSSGTLHTFFNINMEGHVHNAMYDVESIVESLFCLLNQDV